MYENSKIVKLIEAKSGMVDGLAGEKGNRAVLVRGYGFSYARLISPRNLLYNLVPIVNNNY